MPQDVHTVRWSAHSDVSAFEMNRWRQIVRRFPEVRLEKVLAARRSLLSNEYDYHSEGILSDTIVQVARDIGLPWAGAGTIADEPPMAD